VYICEDHPEQRKVISQYIRSAILIEEYDMKIGMETEDPEKILEAVRNSENMGLYFLDIELNTNMNGLVLADRIREYDPRGFIVFITSHSEMSFLTFQYKVEALDFILKDHPQKMQRQICECMKHVMQKYSKITRGSGKTISITRGGRRITLEYQEIIFFETSSNEHKLIVHTKNKSIEFFGKMKEIENEVGEEFIRCHRAYLVNKANIQEVNYEDKCIIMKTQERCPISHRMLGQIKKKI
ncbi:MAG: LytTR family DNA-binding domain-containing protein, partial [Eubacterium sp.]|nr:LytTR family DNA-binding domain-containing protein [Eubacterium sp.]